MLVYNSAKSIHFSSYGDLKRIYKDNKKFCAINRKVAEEFASKTILGIIFNLFKLQL